MAVGTVRLLSANVCKQPYDIEVENQARHALPVNNLKYLTKGASMDILRRIIRTAQKELDKLEG